jgi:hypothetical protein
MVWRIGMMQVFEKPRYERALAAFADGFARAYAAAKQELASGTVNALGDTDSVFYVDVPRDDVLDDEWSHYTALFEEAGRVAALAKRRTGEAKLDAADADPDGRHAAVEGKLRWTVILNPRSE